MTAAADENGAAAPKDANGDLAKENLWSEILGEVQKQGSTKLPSNKSVLVLGDNASGKTTLIAKLQGVEDPKKGFGLEYAYIDVRDEYRDDVTRLGVWVLDGDPGHANLLRFALNEANYSHTLVILTVSMNTPWMWMEQCQHWMKILADHVEKLSVPSEERQVARERLLNRWQTYCETMDDLDSSSPMKRSTVTGGGAGGGPMATSTGGVSALNRLSSVDDVDADILPLPEGTLTSNLGLDIVVVVTKTDYMTTLEKEFDYRDEQFDFMQQWIRRFCLTHGASLFYTSVKEDKNCDLLYKYLTHRIYGLPFRTPALVVEKDAVLIPAGWDNLKKISILYENMHSCKPEDYYPDIILAPPSRKTQTNREADVQTEEEQSFLARQQQMLMAGQAPAARGESPMRGQPGTPKPPMPRTPGQVQGSPKIDAKLTPGQPGGEGILANFFNSLLHKKAGTPGSPNVSLDGSNNFNSMPPSGERGARSSSVTRGQNPGDTPIDKMRTDAAAELDRLSRSAVKKEIDFSAPEATQSDC